LFNQQHKLFPSSSNKYSVQPHSCREDTLHRRTNYTACTSVEWRLQDLYLPEQRTMTGITARNKEWS